MNNRAFFETGNVSATLMELVGAGLVMSGHSDAGYPLLISGGLLDLGTILHRYTLAEKEMAPYSRMKFTGKLSPYRIFRNI